jgi:Ca2+-binding RTX toxin-like protein
MHRKRTVTLPGVLYIPRCVRHKEDRSMKRASLLTMSVALFLVLATGVALAATINGTSGNDFLRGTNSADNIGARGGNDEVRARAGADQVFGGTQSDTLYGMDGGDLVVGGDGNDGLEGGIGNDTLKSHNDGNADNLSCGPGNDTVFVELNDVIADENADATAQKLVNTAVNNTLAPVTSCETLKVFILGQLDVTISLNPVTGIFEIQDA